MPDAHAPSTLAAMRDHNRVLLIFATDAQDRRLQRQLTELEADPAEFRDRNMMLVLVLEHGNAATGGSELPTAVLSKEEAAATQHKYNPGGGFAVVLLGKDGGQKLLRREVIERASLYDSIDRMPMRQAEMKARHP